MQIKGDLKRVEWQGRIFLVPHQPGESRPPLVLNETADRLLQLLAAPTTREALLVRLKAEYDVEEATLAADLDDFLARLRALGLLEE